MTHSSAYEIGVCPDCGSSLSDARTLINIAIQDGVLLRLDRCAECGAESESMFTEEVS